MGTYLTPDQLRRLEGVALGKEAADLILTGGDVLNVHTGEILAGNQILVAGNRIAYVGEEKDFPIAESTKVIDISGSVVIPGLIDAHCHIDFWLGLGDYATHSLPGGTTTIITECPAVTNAKGMPGVLAWLDSFPNYPMRFYATAPVIPYISSIREEGPGAVTQGEMEKLLEHPAILGLGEIYWSKFIDKDEDEYGLFDLISKAKALGKTVEGHGAGAKRRKLAALAAAGIESCHEPISAEDVRERLRLGLSTMIREGSIRRELEAVIKPLINMNLDLRRAILVSDGVWPGHLIEYGHMDFIVNKAISLGLDPVKAIQMATLNAAEHFRLDGELGSITPGKLADMVITPGIKGIKAQLVICGGQVVAEEGTLTLDLPSERYPENFLTGLNMPAVQPSTFGIKAKGKTVEVIAIEMITDIVNRPVTLQLPVAEGLVQIGETGDLLKIAVLDRYEGKGRKAVGFIKGYGLREGAIATSLSFDEGNAVVIGKNDEDIARAVNRLREIKGGMVYCQNQRIIEELPLPVLGSIAQIPGREVAERISSLVTKLRAGGCRHGDPLLTLFTTTFTAIPSIRLTVRGYWLSKENRIVDLFA